MGCCSDVICWWVCALRTRVILELTFLLGRACANVTLFMSLLSTQSFHMWFRSPCNAVCGLLVALGDCFVVSEQMMFACDSGPEAAMPSVMSGSHQHPCLTIECQSARRGCRSAPNALVPFLANAEPVAVPPLHRQSSAARAAAAAAAPRECLHWRTSW